MGINVGAALGAFACGLVGQTYGWAYGFGLAGFGMLLGLLVFVVFRPLLLGRGAAPDPAALKKRVAGVKLGWLPDLFGVAAVGVSWFMFQLQELVGWFLGGAGGVIC